MYTDFLEVVVGFINYGCLHDWVKSAAEQIDICTSNRIYRINLVLLYKLLVFSTSLDVFGSGIPSGGFMQVVVETVVGDTGSESEHR